MSSSIARHLAGVYPAVDECCGENSASRDEDRRKSTTGEVGDEELIKSLGRGDVEAFGELFDRYHGVVSSIAVRVLRDSGEAEDAVQEVFLDLIEGLPSFDEEKGTVKSWIACLAYHRCLKRRRYLSLRNFYGQAPIESVYTALDVRVDPNLWIRTIDLERCLQRALAELPEKQRSVFEMFFLEGRELREIAVYMQESFANTRNHLYRGLAKLRDRVRTDELLAGYETSYARVKRV